MGFFDFEFKMDDIKKHQPPLQKLNKVIDWEIFRPMLESALLNKNKAKSGRLLSFMDFLNLELSDKIPDAKTIWFFKNQLCKKWTHGETL